MKKIILNLVFIAVLTFASAPLIAQSDWIVLEETTLGTRYIRKNTPLGKNISHLITMIDLKNIDYVNTRDGPKSFSSISFSEKIDCDQYSRMTFYVTYHSKQMGTGSEILSHPVNGKKYSYSREEWLKKGFDTKLCKKTWEFWK